jgi:plastocyanin
MIRTCLCFTVLTFSLFNALALLAAGSRYFGSTTQHGKDQTVEVKIDNFSFSPPNLTVTVGTTVTWINRDDLPHTVVSSDDPKSIRVQGVRHRRQVFVHFHEGRNLFVLLLHSPNDDRQSRGPVSENEHAIATLRRPGSLA